MANPPGEWPSSATPANTQDASHSLLVPATKRRTSSPLAQPGESMASRSWREQGRRAEAGMIPPGEERLARWRWEEVLAEHARQIDDLRGQITDLSRQIDPFRRQPTKKAEALHQHVSALRRHADMLVRQVNEFREMLRCAAIQAGSSQADQLAEECVEEFVKGLLKDEAYAHIHTDECINKLVISLAREKIRKYEERVRE